MFVLLVFAFLSCPVHFHVYLLLKLLSVCHPLGSQWVKYLSFHANTFCVQVPTPSMSWGCGSICSKQLGVPTRAVVSHTSFFFFTHYVVCAGTTQWQPHHGDTTSSCHMAATATHGRALLHDMPLPDGDMTGSTATAVIRWQHGWQHTAAWHVAAWQRHDCSTTGDSSATAATRR